ncbi:MAG: flavodoxin-dependent (E)-4-hydroxy-3-methylbut-2-enyl-diphosphate synthase [Victivallaceae bacterium]|nr:flavodoxin-dependent (E)-4-hydroxy-3-methylbut-2-enyl-diphosphate synthase [Victivallaceae bacterium]
MTYKQRRQITVGNILIGGGAPVSIQSMTNTDTRDADATLQQIEELFSVGCQIIRVAVPDMIAVAVLPEIIAQSPIPVLADIHFDYRLALGAIAAGVHGLRLNPGNIGDQTKIAKVAECAGEAGIPIRVGANSGSLPQDLLESKLANGMSHADALAESLVESVLEQCNILENYGFNAIKVSLKASDVPVTLQAYRKFAQLSDYPLHIGITEAGTLKRGTIKSAVGIGALLLDGLGDTLRVSLTAAPIEEVKLAKTILECAGIRQAYPEIVSCPTCGRTEIDLISLAEKVEGLVEQLKTDGHIINMKKIAVMGCIVNGPGEAQDADIGIAGGKENVILFRHGKKIGVYSEAEAFEELERLLLGT